MKGHKVAEVHVAFRGGALSPSSAAPEAKSPSGERYDVLMKHCRKK